MHDESVYALRVLKAGAKGYVMKQDIANKVLDGIQKIRKGQMYFSEKVTSQVLNRMMNGQDTDSESPVSSLSDRELEVVALVAQGHTNQQVADRLFLSVKTIETHRAHIKTKLNLKTATQLVQFCVRWVEDARRAAGEQM